MILHGNDLMRMLQHIIDISGAHQFLGFVCGLTLLWASMISFWSAWYTTKLPLSSSIGCIAVELMPQAKTCPIWWYHLLTIISTCYSWLILILWWIQLSSLRLVLKVWSSDIKNTLLRTVCALYRLLLLLSGCILLMLVQFYQECWDLLLLGLRPTLQPLLLVPVLRLFKLPMTHLVSWWCVQELDLFQFTAL